jgi:hypothetical protein
MRAALFLLLSAAILSAQDPGTIHGTVRDALTGTPLSGVTVYAGRRSAVTNPQGAFTIGDVPAGEVRIRTSSDMAASSADRKVMLASGQDVAADLRIQTLGRISGAVTDADGKPVSDVMVSAVTREYSLGAIRYTLWYGSLTNEWGEFGTRSPSSLQPPSQSGSTAGRQLALMDQARAASASRTGALFMGSGMALETGRGYLLLASKGRAVLAREGEFDPDPARRKPVSHATWYIGARGPESALPLTLAPAERRDGLHISMATGPGYCIHGTLRANALPGGMLQVDLAEAPMPVQGILGHTKFAHLLAAEAPLETTLHICNLSPGDYRVSSVLVSKPNSFPREFRTQVVTVADRDVNFSLDGDPPARISGEIVWAGEPPEEATTITLQLRPLNHAPAADESVTTKIAAPGAFVFERLLADEYALQVTGIPEDAYLKDVTSAGRSVLHRPLSAATGDVRVILALDGAQIVVQSEPDTWLAAFPASAATEIDIADTVVSGRTDDSGVWTSPVLAPGPYLILSSPVPIDRSVECIGRLYRSRSNAQQADLAANSTVTTTLNR